MGATTRGKGTTLMAMADGTGLPLAVDTAAATPHDVTLVPKTLAPTLTTHGPARRSGDNADDREPLDAALAARGLEMMAPHRAHRPQAATPEGRPWGGTVGGGRSSADVPGGSTSAGGAYATTIMPRTSWAVCIWAVG